jgi:putative membrane protein
MMWGYHDGFGWWMLFGGISMILFWGVLVWVAIVAVRSLSGTPGRREEDPEEIARRRFAAGEISEEEFRRIQRALHS